MKRKEIIIVGSIIIVFTMLIGWLDNVSPQKINWKKTYDEEGTAPFDIKVFYEQLRTVYKEYKIVQLKETFYEYQSKKKKSDTLQKNKLYLTIADKYKPDRTSENELLQCIGEGNSAFISANYFTKTLLDSLGITHNKTEKNLYQKLPIQLSTQENQSKLTYVPKLKYYQPYFLDSTNIEVLGKAIFTTKDSILKNRATFIKVRYKHGFFYLHAHPEIFSNYELLKSNSTAYINTLLTHLTEKNLQSEPTQKLLLFDSNVKIAKEVISSPLRFIKSQIELRWAWNLLLFGLLLFILINAKRKQRVIPILPKVRNTSLDFVSTVALLYEEADNFQPIIEQKIHIFFRNIRTRYHLITDKTNTNLAEQLSLKSGYDLVKTRDLLRLITLLKERETSSITLLHKLNQEIENFYKNTQAWKN
ncbi:hypothetical protein [Ochrovirga pacifica]|uniref:hypothetical protein n=1 Tax=Ochrovirga pacifica TaxID=1042376 RepID=UPI0002559B20|nr:hypothetical protein [Ochrovirga pacifica]